MVNDIGCAHARPSGLRVGIDFDNTIVSYDELMHETAVGWGLIDDGQRRDKKGVRDLLRQLPGGENHWRRLQTFAYGEGMSRARPMEGVKDFLLFCCVNSIPVWIVSHKTEYNNFGAPTVNLRQAALKWLEEQGFFDEATTGLCLERVFFEATLKDKVARIANLALSNFVDDLEETFLEPDFPITVSKIHYVPHGEPSTIARALHATSWSAIVAHFRALAGASTSGS